MYYYEYRDLRIVYVEILDCFRENKVYYISLGFRVWKCVEVSFFIICKSDFDCKNSYFLI